MRFLSIDTSTKYSVVALFDEKRLLCGRRSLFKRGRSKAIFGLIEDCLKKTKTKIAAIDYFGVGLGPGSFTGLRIAVSAVKAFNFDTGSPVLTFSSLDAIAWNVTGKREGRLCVFVDAKRSSLYVRFYDLHGSLEDGLRRGSPDLLLRDEAFFSRLEDKMIFFGDGLKLYKEEIEARVSGAVFAPENRWYPTPQGLCRLTWESLRAQRKTDHWRLSPVYLYKKDCQVRPACNARR